MSYCRDRRQSEEMLEIANPGKSIEILDKRRDIELGILSDKVKLGSVASRQNNALFDIRYARQTVQRVRQRGVWNDESLTHFDIRRLMTDAETQDIH